MNTLCVELQAYSFVGRVGHRSDSSQSLSRVLYYLLHRASHRTATLFWILAYSRLRVLDLYWSMQLDHTLVFVIGGFE